MLSLASRTIGRRVASRASVPALEQITRRGYHENIVEHYENPRNVGSLDKNEISVGTVRDESLLLLHQRVKGPPAYQKEARGGWKE